MTEEDLTCPNRKPGSRRCNCRACRDRRGAIAGKRARIAFAKAMTERTVWSAIQVANYMSVAGFNDALLAACVAYTGGAQKKDG